MEIDQNSKWTWFPFKRVGMSFENLTKIWIRMDPRWFGSLDPDPPWDKKLDPDRFETNGDPQHCWRD
jgi:hypothetical protein